MCQAVSCPLLYVQYCDDWAKKLRILTGENKFDFRAAVKRGESGIFVGRDVYYLVMGPPALRSFGRRLAYENAGVSADLWFAVLK